MLGFLGLSPVKNKEWSLSDCIQIFIFHLLTVVLVEAQKLPYSYTWLILWQWVCKRRWVYALKHNQDMPEFRISKNVLPYLVKYTLVYVHLSPWKCMFFSLSSHLQILLAHKKTLSEFWQLVFSDFFKYQLCSVWSSDWTSDCRLLTKKLWMPISISPCMFESAICMQAFTCIAFKANLALKFSKLILTERHWIYLSF